MGESDDATRMVEPPERLREVLQQYWGFDTLRPMQAEAIAAGLTARDSLVVMPTGGGKSLCFQVPPIVADRVDVVVSPLISLMKDQVDGLRRNGYPAAALHSGQSADERNAAYDALRERTLRLLFVSPERLASDGFRRQLAAAGIHSFAIDEAHCISHWGHDFRPEYRQLSTLREHFPEASMHAFTATATPRVQEDIARQLGLREPSILVGDFDRPNLTYRIQPRVDRTAQIASIVRRHQDQAVIIYCITRKDTEQLAQTLSSDGISAKAYHAGLAPEKRHKVQEAFAEERLDVVVATVAFGMGIDRSDVRCVIHAAMPKSIEHYQQETGRAGRDGLEAECVLLYSAADGERWRGLMERAAAESGASSDAEEELLSHMQGLCSTIECRHRALKRYFGQTYEPENCGACDVCLGEIESMPGSTLIARKILSGVARLDQRFGVGHVVATLRGANNDAIRRNGHDQLSTYGLLRELPEKVLTNLVYQLIDLGLLVRSSGDRPVVRLTEDAVPILRGDGEVALLEPRGKRVKTTKGEAESWDGVDRELFDHLRGVRRDIAQDEGIPAYLVFSDRTLRDMSRVRPATLESMRTVHGVGERKLADYGERFLEEIAGFGAGGEGEEKSDDGAPVVEVVKDGVEQAEG